MEDLSTWVGRIAHHEILMIIVQNTNFLGDAGANFLTSKLLLFTPQLLKDWPSNSSTA